MEFEPLLRDKRAEILDVASKHGARNVRILGHSREARRAPIAILTF